MEFLQLFRDGGNLEEHDAQSLVFSEQDRAELMYVILSGEIELTLHGESLGIEREGGIIGEMAMIDSVAYGSTATTVTDVKLARLDRGQLEACIGKNSEFAFHVMSVMANRLRSVDKYIKKQITKSS